ncbi:MAG: hypothetical protein EOP39_16525 [Rubrivivax sp.]|nr:MAG: hypothetical protein EOP39_16525 [Rubrivivax sp.]
MKSLLIALLVCVALPVLAQTQVRQTQVYRCGPDGRDLRDSPCPGPKAGESTVNYDQPSTADSKAARERHITEAKQAAALSAARRASEAEARRSASQATVINTLPTPSRAASAPQVAYLKPPKTAKPKKPSAPGSGPR